MNKRILLLSFIGLSGCFGAGPDIDANGESVHVRTTASSGPFEVIQMKRGYANDAENKNWFEDIVIKVDKTSGESWILYPLDGVPGRDDDSNDHSFSWVPVPEFIPEFLNTKPKDSKNIP